jgi:hypothetical protein
MPADIFPAKRRVLQQSDQLGFGMPLKRGGKPPLQLISPIVGPVERSNRFRRVGFDPASLKEGTRITIRAFFAMDKTLTPRVDSGLIDLEVEFVDPQTKKLFANILTELPSSFPLARGTSIELDLDEVLTVQTKTRRR